MCIKTKGIPNTFKAVEMYNYLDNYLFIVGCRHSFTPCFNYFRHSALYKGQLAERSTGFDPHEKSAVNLNAFNAQH